jgi:hypothetical protein
MLEEYHTQFESFLEHIYYLMFKFLSQTTATRSQAEPVNELRLLAGSQV